jgi:type IV pilus assembly protein PilX
MSTFLAHCPPLAASRPAQRGFSLFSVLVMLLLSALLAIGGARMAQLLEATAGNQREHQRAFEAAEAALVDAQRDIQGFAFDAATQTYQRCAGSTPCRQAGVHRIYPDPTGAVFTSYSDVGLNSCKDGICYFEGAVSAASGSEAFEFWKRTAYADKFAKYGQFTGAPTGGNQALANAGYWVEAIQRKGQPLYRITTFSTGTRTASKAGGTHVSLQVSFDPDAIRPLH